MSTRPRRPTLRHRIEYLAYRSLVGVLRALPERIALRLGEGLGWTAGFVFRIRWTTVMDHLRHAFPEAGPSWRRRVAAGSFRHMGREAVATFRLGTMDQAEVRARTEVVGFDAFKESLAAGNGVMVITGHFGNWEVGGASLACRGVPLDVVAQRQRNPLFDVDLNENRRRLGMTPVERRDAPKRVLRSLREGRAVAIVGDQNLRRGGVFVEFFGRRAATARGAAVFALRTGSPIFLGVAVREPGFPQRYRVSLTPVEFLPSGDRDADAIRLTQLHARYLEEQVKAQPEQYFWQHRRWKTRPPREA